MLCGRADCEAGAPAGAWASAVSHGLSNHGGVQAYCAGIRSWQKPPGSMRPFVNGWYWLRGAVRRSQPTHVSTVRSRLSVWPLQRATSLANGMSGGSRPAVVGGFSSRQRAAVAVAARTTSRAEHDCGNTAYPRDKAPETQDVAHTASFVGRLLSTSASISSTLTWPCVHSDMSRQNRTGTPVVRHWLTALTETPKRSAVAVVRPCSRSSHWSMCMSPV